MILIIENDRQHFTEIFNYLTSKGLECAPNLIQRTKKSEIDGSTILETEYDFFIADIKEYLILKRSETIDRVNNYFNDPNLDAVLIDIILVNSSNDKDKSGSYLSKYFVPLSKANCPVIFLSQLYKKEAVSRYGIAETDYYVQKRFENKIENKLDISIVGADLIDMIAEVRRKKSDSSKKTYY